MVNKNKMKYILLNVMTVTLVLLFTAVIYLNFKNTKNTVAGENTIEIKVDKLTTISIYAFGEGVDLIESTQNYDLYKADINTNVRLQAVNESRIFTSWVITTDTPAGDKILPNIADLTQNIISFTVSEDMNNLHISANRTNASPDDYGRYMMDRYVIVDTKDLIALQNIINGTGTNADYARYYQDESAYSTPAAKEIIREKLRFGYFLISSNFTVFDDSFKGIGTKEKPFQGIVCGNNGINSSLFVTINDTEQEGEKAYGLFSYLGEKAIIRNLKLSVSIGIAASNITPIAETTIYAGGLAGVMDRAKLINVVVSTNIGIDSNIADNIYVGGITGELKENSGIDFISDIVYDGTNSNWSVVSHKQNSSIYAGFVSGKSTDSYIKEVDLTVTNQSVEIKNDSIENEYSSSQLFLGNIFGYYHAKSLTEKLNDIMIMGNNGETLSAVTTNGNAYVGGMIGYVRANQTGKLNIGDLYFRVLNTENEYSASSVSTSNVTNLYAGGLIGFIEGNQVLGAEEFKNRIKSIVLEDMSTSLVANYLFEGNYQIRTIQNGTSYSTNEGKSVAGGLVGKGIIDLGGTNEKRSKIAIASPTSSLIIQADQSKLSKTGDGLTINDKEHASAALIFGSVGTNNINVSNIDIYTNNTTIKTLRDSGSNAIGDLHTGAFVSYATGSNFSNIGLYLNDSNIVTHSLSYERSNGVTDTNNAFCGGFAGELVGNSSLTNIVLSGYDINDFTLKGTTTNLESTQNTVPGSGDYKGENYIGGIVGRIRDTYLENCIFNGSETSDNYIRMNGHESPDSAFCGGIVGLIKVNDENNISSSIIDCSIKNTEISGNATCSKKYSNPDIYVGGIVGAAYLHSTSSTVTIEGCSLINSSVYAYGNEIIATYAGGIIGGATWQSSVTITDCYVTDSTIISSGKINKQDTNVIESSAAGIIGMCGADTSVTISNCAVIDTNIESLVEGNYNNISSYAAGISGYTESDSVIPSIKNCYSNAIVDSSNSATTNKSKVYAIAYKCSIETETKAVTVETPKITYQDFTYNNYTFEAISETSGTYRIRTSAYSYVRIANNGNISYVSSNRATTVTFNNGNLVYNGNYISFDGSNTIVYGNTPFDFSDIINKTETSVLGTQNITSLQSYFSHKNVKVHDDNYGTSLHTGPYQVVEGAKVNPYENDNYMYGFDGTGQKLYIEILGDDSKFTVNHERDRVTFVTSNSSDASTLAHIWINIKAEGGPDSIDGLYKPDHENKEEAAQNGWFIFDYVLLYSSDLVEISSDISNIDVTYTDGTKSYEHRYDDVEGNDSINEHYLINKNNNEDIILNNYEEYNVSNNLKEFTFKVYDNMLYMSMDFEITHFGANYKLLFVDEDGNLIEDDNFKKLYGEMSLNLTVKHASETTDKYNLIYVPNNKITEDATFYVRFVGGNNAISSQTSLKINLKANKWQLVGLTYADYTLPLNYFEDSSLLGTEDLPYYLHIGSITKFIPIFTKSNDLEVGKLYISETNIEKCEYSIDSTTAQYFDILSSGQLQTLYEVNKEGTLTVSYETYSIEIHFISANDVPVSYSIAGADIQGLTRCSNTTDFYFEQHIKSNYGGVPHKFIITIGTTVYDLTNDPKAYPNIKVYYKAKTRSTSLVEIDQYDIEISEYVVIVNKSLLTGNISNVNVEVEFPIVYTITFNLQCEMFNNQISELVKTFKISSGTKFKDFFASSNGLKTYKEEVMDWVKSAEIFGFVFTGFYLVNDASSINAYGVGFEELTNSEFIVNSSNTFYGRWSYLIELVEASGTYIKTGFNSEFMQDYKGENFNRAIQIPINANQGYVFKVETDSHYVGQAGVKAYIVNYDSLGNKQMLEVPLEYYQNNKNLYFVRPEYITGYLVIMTTVSNSEIIVGENSSSITENITTEDGIITFKYVTNHYNDGDNQSYIYNLKNGVDYKTLKKEFVLDFYKESDHSDLELPDLTEIRVYYNAFINGSTTPSNTIVGTYITRNDDRVYLSEFKLLDFETNAFPNSKSFGESLMDYKSLTEVYYFTITPPNGYTEKVKNEMANYVVECGYCYEKVSNGEPIHYLEGDRNKKELANPDDLNDVVSIEKMYESAKQDKIYHIIPSRDTRLDIEENGTYTFTDDKTYSIYDIILTDTQRLPDFNYVSLYNDAKHSIFESTNMSFAIRELRLKLGYRLGTVTIYGKTADNNAEWEKVTDVEIKSAIYDEYVVDFKNSLGQYPYVAYRIENFSTNEVRISEIDVVSKTNNVVYETIMSNIVEKGLTDGKYIYSVKQNIIGDSRHDGKVFMLAVQLKDKQNNDVLIDNIIGDIYINVNDIGLPIYHYASLNNLAGKNVAYINLSSIISVLRVSQINFNLSIPEDYQVHEIQLLEVENEYKPASGEVRLKYSTAHVHYYVDGLCSCGDLLEGYVSLTDEFAQMLVKDFNTAGGNSATTINEFYATSGTNISKVWTSPTMSAKYQWFFEFMKSEITTIAKANNVLTSAEYLNTIELLNNMIVGAKPTTIFTRGDYSSAIEIIRYYIHGLINKLEVEDINASSVYSKFLVNYFDQTNRARFLNQYGKSKVTIKIGVYNTSGLVSGGFTENDAITDTISVNYFTDNSILPANGGGNNLRWQNKILMNKVAPNVYKIIAVANARTSSSDYNIATNILWTHAITTAYNVDFESLYGSHVGSYIIIDDKDVAVRNTSYSDTYHAFRDLTWDKYFDAIIVDEVHELVDKIVVDPNGSGDYTNLQTAINEAQNGDIISVVPGTYGAVTINKAITLEGANVGINPVTQSRGEETTFTEDITVASSDVKIDGIKLTDSGQIRGANSSISNITIQNVVVNNSTVNKEKVNSTFVSNDAPIYFASTTSGVEYNNIVIDQVKYTESGGRAMILYGAHINGLTITNSYFSANATGNYNDGIKIDSSDGYGIKGNVVIKNNYFEKFEQYTVWFDDYSEGTYDIINNIVQNCYMAVPIGSMYSTFIRFGAYHGETSGKVYVNCLYNTVDTSGSLIRLDVNSSRTSTTQIVKVNYNKITNNKNTGDFAVFIDHRNSYNIDATNNYYGTTPTATTCKNATYSPYYTTAGSVPLYSGD